MHLLNAEAVPADSAEAVDLGQSPGDIVVVSAADTELSLLAGAQRRRLQGAGQPSLRLANFLQLRHPMSVDLYLDQTLSQAKLVVLRLLGGRSYWPYGLERVAAICRARGIALACLPGDDKPDAELAGWSTLEAETCRRLWLYLVHGGAENAESFLAFAGELIGRPSPWSEPAPLLTAGCYREDGPAGAPMVLVVFYRALLQAGDTAPIDALCQALVDRRLRVRAVYVTSLKDPTAAALIRALLAEPEPQVIVNATAFAIGNTDAQQGGTLLDQGERPVLQVVLSSEREAAWAAGSQGLLPRELAMYVALPELDGRLMTRAIAFKEVGDWDSVTEIALRRSVPVPDRVAAVADLAANWVALAATERTERQIAVVMANYPNRDGRLANGVGLDTPASAVTVLEAMAGAGYHISNLPKSAAELMDQLRAGPTNELRDRHARLVRVRLPLEDYEAWFSSLPAAIRNAVLDRWGPAANDPHVEQGAFALSLLPLGHVVIGIQPSRGYHIDPDASYHDPDLVPPHGYFAFYAWLREAFHAQAIVHLGKHGNLEWLPGKALALSRDCFPDAILGPLPHLYPFIVNDPGEGSQAKRRTAAVIIDHLTPPLTRAGPQDAYGELEQRVDEYAEAVHVDGRRAELLRREILDTTERLGLDGDLGLNRLDSENERLAALDAHLCELKELQIRDGLHVFGASPEADQRTDLLLALARAPRGERAADTSILLALARDLGLAAFDPLSRSYAAEYAGPRPAVLAAAGTGPWRTAGDTVERLEVLARRLVAGYVTLDPSWDHTRAVMAQVRDALAPRLDACGGQELEGLLRGLDGRFVAPGPSGAPTRGRPDVLPTGRNFFSLDSRAVPTPAAWQLGWRSAQLIVDRYAQEQGEWPSSVALSAWGTANMRTGGDDIAQALALLGVRPRWDGASHRVIGTEILPLDQLGRPRVDVTLRVSGFFRDAFPAQMALFDEAVQAVAQLDEPPESNPLAAKVVRGASELEANGVPKAEAFRRASFRVFGSKPGSYGAGLQALIDERGWSSDADLAEAFLVWGGYAYGSGGSVETAPDVFADRLSGVRLVLHNQDNREHDLLDSDDYYQFEGGLTAAVRVQSGNQPRVFHNDHSRPDHPQVRSLEEELSLIVRGRATNPKWLRGVMRHGYKGAAEIAATVDYLFAFAATTRMVGDHHFDAVYEAYLIDPEVRNFIADANPDALREIEERLGEAMERGLWHPQRNDFRSLSA